MTNLTDLDVTSLTVSSSATRVNALDTTQAMTADGAITIKNGIVTLSKAGVLAATLANPTATTDDFKQLTIISLSAQAMTVTVTGGFGNGGSGKDIATFGGAIGDCMTVMAYQGYWYVIGLNSVTLA